MKVQEVILRAINWRLKWYQATEILAISDRQMRRWKWCYEQWGYDGLFHRRRQLPSPMRMPLERVRQVLTLNRERYSDLNVLHFHEEQFRLLEKANPYFLGRRVESPYPGSLLCQDTFLVCWLKGIERERRRWTIGMS